MSFLTLIAEKGVPFPGKENTETKQGIYQQRERGWARQKLAIPAIAAGDDDRMMSYKTSMVIRLTDQTLGSKACGKKMGNFDWKDISVISSAICRWCRVYKYILASTINSHNIGNIENQLYALA